MKNHLILDGELIPVKPPLTQRTNGSIKSRMISRILLALALVLAGCSTFTDAELAQIRQRGLRPELFAKMEHRRSLDPEDLIELRRAGVPDEQVEKQLNDVGVNYVATSDDAVRLRKARVGARIIDALLRASDRFAGRQYSQPYDDGWNYGDPWGPEFCGDWTVGFSPRWHSGSGWQHHR